MDAGQEGTPAIVETAEEVTETYDCPQSIPCTTHVEYLLQGKDEMFPILQEGTYMYACAIHTLNGVVAAKFRRYKQPAVIGVVEILKTVVSPSLCLTPVQL